jgi:hypothetical protein
MGAPQQAAPPPAPPPAAANHLLRNLVASSSTGAIVMAFTNPLDTLKARWQVMPTGQLEVASTTALARLVVREEGFVRGLWAPALGTNMLACSLAVGARLGFYPHIRDALCGRTDTGAVVKQPARMFASGLMAGAVGYLVANPLFLVTKRIQAGTGRVENGVVATGARKGMPPGERYGVSALRSLAVKDGLLKGLWFGSGLLVLRGAVMSASQTTAYDWSKSTIRRNDWIDDGPPLHFLCSFAASIVCVTCVIPFDVVLTRYQTAGQQGVVFSSPMDAARTLLREEGPRVFGRGWVVMFSRMAPSSVLSFYVFEQLRRVVGLGYMT